MSTEVAAQLCKGRDESVAVVDAHQREVLVVLLVRDGGSRHEEEVAPEVVQVPGELRVAGSRHAGGWRGWRVAGVARRRASAGVYCRPVRSRSTIVPRRRRRGRTVYIIDVTTLLEKGF